MAVMTMDWQKNYKNKQNAIFMKLKKVDVL